MKTTSLKAKNHRGSLGVAESIVRKLLCVSIAITTLAARADTTVSGTVSGETWTSANSPYLVTDNVLVGDLVIEAGVQVLFQGNYVFEVAGVLTVAGSSNAPVVFTRTNGGWQGIFFNFSSPGSELRYAEISGAVNSGVRIVNSVPVFRNCSFIGNSSPGYGGGMLASMPSGDLVLDRCTFSNNRSTIHGGGLWASLTSGTVVMSDCMVSDNIANPSVNNGEYVGGGIGITGKAWLSRSLIQGNISYSACTIQTGNYCAVLGRAGGAYFHGNATIVNCRFVGNLARAHIYGDCRYGGDAYAQGGAIYFYDGNLYVRNSILNDNSAVTTGCVNHPRGGGIFVNAGIGSVINVTCAYNVGDGLWGGGGTTRVTNSISYFNSGSQIGGTVTATFSDVQNGYVGTGNIDFQPIFQSRSNLTIISASRCKDAGDPNPIYNDTCFPPSLGTERNDMGAHGGPGACCWFEECDAPTIRNHPQNSVACVGTDATFCVSATGTAPLSYQWRFHGPIAGGAPVEIVGGTNACLTISNVQSNNAGYYSVLVASPLGSLASEPALLTVTPVCVDLELYAGLTISGGVAGQPYRVQSVLNANDTNWTTQTTVTQSAAGLFWLDPQPATGQRKFYRVVP